MIIWRKLIELFISIDEELLFNEKGNIDWEILLDYIKRFEDVKKLRFVCVLDNFEFCLDIEMFIIKKVSNYLKFFLISISGSILIIIICRYEIFDSLGFNLLIVRLN